MSDLIIEEGGLKAESSSPDLEAERLNSISKTAISLERASRSQLLQVLIYLNKAEEKRLLKNFIYSNTIIET